MNWTNVRLILQRENRDQLRDRRTLFMIFVLPVLLYPLLGVTFMQLGQLAREEPTKVYVVGGENLPAEPALIVAADGRPQFAALEEELKPDADLLEITQPKPAANPAELRQQLDDGQARVRD